MFRVKICGITNVDDARMVADAGADAIGLNFFPQSPRFIDVETAAAIGAVTPSLLKVGVFVNATRELILETVLAVGLDAVQLHGDEPPEYLAHLPPCPIIRAFRCPAGLEQAGEYIAACENKPAVVLVDAFTLSEYGGSGKVADWSAITSSRGCLNGVPLVLAGGLNSTNVATAIVTVRPVGVDTASGVELAPGRKDPDAVRAFTLAARKAFAGL